MRDARSPWAEPLSEISSAHAESANAAADRQKLARSGGAEPSGIKAGCDWLGLLGARKLCSRARELWEQNQAGPSLARINVFI